MASLTTETSHSETQINPDIDIKKAGVTDKLKKREDVRIAELQKRKEEKDNVSALNESADFFLSNFSKIKKEIDDALNDAEKLSKDKLPDHFATLNKQYQSLQKFTTDTAMFLPPYEIQKAQEIVGKLQRDIQERKDVLIPKKKFAFKSKKKIATEAATQEKLKQEVIMKKDINMEITDCSFSDISSQTLEKSAVETNDIDVALARLTDCVVKLFGSPRAVHIDKLVNCRVFIGPVSGSIFIDHCENCTFVMACQQLRTHHTTKSHFYIHVTSKAIIEDCSSVQFAPFNWQYEGLDDSYKLSGLDQSINNWDDVDDFNWLASDAHSPNWNILEESKRVKNWDL